MNETGIEEQETGMSGFWHRYRLLIVVALIGTAIIGWLVVSKGMAVRQAEQAAAAQRAAWVTEIEAREAGMTKQSLQTFAIPLAWAVRRELMADNLDQVDQYVSELVKQTGFEQVVVAKADGVVAVASDRKNLGIRFDSLYPVRYLTTEQIDVEETTPGRWQVFIPIMGLNARLGTVAIDYTTQPAAPDASP
jgi:hypothetical protein